MSGIVGLDHVQLAMPRGGEERARAFYAGVLGMAEAAKPAVLAARGGVWFTAGAAEVHLGVEDDFRPARKAHPALSVHGLAAMLEACRAAGCEIADAEPLEGCERAYVSDPFGNRVELIERS
ncbi:VOC family protein [Longimicrobium sp.]|uniref:VOC family protein n=1 Tax=Longimicrobium sp. TaxID=2029185 RepID=UPI002C2FBC53|nr:VOC family protein [Longimicrobium sp.]HSU15547.1 VOC family protein [Longimicrobium sp.]